MSRSRDFARSLRRDHTSAEARLWRALRARQVANRKFRRQHPIEGFIVDFVCLDARLVIEVDGDTHCSPEQTSRDASRTRHLERCGFLVMRVTNEDVRANLDGVLDAIWLQLNHRMSL